MAVLSPSARLIPYFTICLLVATCTAAANDDYTKSTPREQRYLTYYGMGLDKWASAWLITRYLQPKNGVEIVDNGSDITTGILFDHPEAAYKRTQYQSTFASLQTAFSLHQPEVDHLSRIIDDIEVNLWRPNGEVESAIVEQGFRQLQRTYALNPETIPLSCYLAFFDQLQQYLKTLPSQNAEAYRPLNTEALLPTKRCVANSIGTILSQNKLVPEVDVLQLLSLLREGKKVIFVDTREPDEFEENHIPGAINLLIRDVKPGIEQIFTDADLVISYCVKDFRGFEMARALKQVGVKHSAILNPYGIRGWIDAGLPVAKIPAISDDALNQLSVCVENPALCLTLNE